MDPLRSPVKLPGRNSVLMRATDGRFIRILEVVPDEDLVIIANINDSTALPQQLRLIELDAALQYRQVVPVDYPEKTYRADDLGDTVRGKFEKAKPALETLLKLGFRRLSEGRMWHTICATAEIYGLNPHTLNGMLGKVVKAGGVLLAAAGDYSRCGRKPSIAEKPHATIGHNSFGLSLQDLERIKQGAKGYAGDATWREAYDAFLVKYYPEKVIFNNGQKVIVPLPPKLRPSFRQFKYHGRRALGLKTILKNKHGERVVQTEHRGKPNGHTEYAIYPGTVSELDWTILDLVAVGRGSRLSVGRLSVYIIADTYSGIIQSIYLTFGNPSFEEACKAIVGCLEDKGELMKKYHVPFDGADWPVSCLPREFRCDKGEVDSWKAQGLVNFAGINIEYCASKRPDQKGTCESFFAVMRWQLRRLRGGTSGMKERIKDHPNVTAIYDFDQVYRLLLNLVMKFNARVRRRQSLSPGMVTDGIIPVPNPIWNWAMERGCVREYSLERARIEILPCVDASVTCENIRLKGLHYRIPAAAGIDPEEWLMRARQGVFTRSFTYDPSTVDYVFLIHKSPEGEKMHLMCPLSEEDKGWAGMSWQEYEDKRKKARNDLISYIEYKQRLINATADGNIKQLTIEAMSKTKEVREGLSTREQIKGTEARRVLEMAEQMLSGSLAVVEDGVVVNPDDFLNDDWPPNSKTG